MSGTLGNNLDDQIEPVLPQQGLLYQSERRHYILCKPKLIPLKSVTLEKLEKMQRDAENKLKEMQQEQRDNA